MLSCMHSSHQCLAIRNLIIILTILTDLRSRLFLSFFFLKMFFLEKISNIWLNLNLLFFLLLLFILFWFHLFHKFVNLLVIFEFFASLFLLKFFFLFLNIIIILDFKPWKLLLLRVFRLIFLVIKSLIIGSSWDKILLWRVMFTKFSESLFRFLELRWLFKWKKFLEILLGRFFFNRFIERMSFRFGHCIEILVYK